MRTPVGWDLRLLAVAAGSWCGALLGVHLTRARPGWAPALLVVAAAACFVVARVAWTGRLAPARLAGSVCAVALLGGAFCGAAHQSRVAPAVILAAAHSRVAVSATLSCSSPASPMRQPDGIHGEPMWSLIGTVRHLTMRGRTYDLSVPVTVEGGQKALSCQPGEDVELGGILRLGPASVAAWGSPIRLRVRAMTSISGPGLVHRSVNVVRRGFGSAAERLEPEPRALVEGLAVGDESHLSDRLRQDMAESGLSHLTAVSGANTAMVVGAVLIVIRWLVLRGLALSIAGRAGVAAVALMAYVLLVGPSPSVLRAAAMGGVGLLAMIVGSPRQALPALLASVVVLVLAAPPLAESPGFALSVAATAGIVVVAGRLAPALAWAGRLAVPLSVALAAHIATLPLVVAIGGGVSLVGVLANLVVEPAVPLITILGLLGAAVSVPAPWLAAMPLWLAQPPAAFIAWVAHFAAGLPMAWLPWPSGWWGIGALILAVMAGFGLRRLLGRLTSGLPPARRRLIAVGMALVLVLVMARPPGSAGWPPTGWAVAACDVGQGDAMVIRLPEPASAVVVDVGPDPELMDECLEGLGIRSIPLLFLSHFHADHVHGLEGVLRGRDVGQIITSPVPDPEAEAVIAAGVAARNRIPIRAATAGEHGSIPGLDWDVLWPRRVIRVADESLANDASLVTLFHVQEAELTLLATGDIEPSAQVAVMASAQVGRVDIAKVPHHGSRHQNPRFASWASAGLAVICVGEGNDYGHPADSTIAQWQAAGSVVRRTDLAGTIAVGRDGDELVVTEQGRSALLPVSRRS